VVCLARFAAVVLMALGSSCVMAMASLPVELSTRIKLIADPGNTLSVSNANEAFASVLHNGKPQLTLSHNTGTYWWSFDVDNPTSKNENYVLELDYIFIQRSELYISDDEGFALLDTINLADSVMERTVVFRKPAFLLEVPSAQTQRYLLKVTLISKPNAALEVRPKLLSFSAFMKAQLTQNIAFFLLIGLFLALALYNAILFLRIGVAGHLFYSLYLLSMVLVVASYEGLLFYLPKPPPAQWVISAISLAPVLSSLCLLAFGRHVLQLDRFRPRVARFYKRTTLIVLVCLPLTLLKLGSFNFWLEITVVLLTIALGVVAATMIKSGQRAAVYFATSFIFIAIGYGIETTLYSLPMLEILGSELALQVIPWMEQYFFYTCSVIEVFFLALALASYIDQLRIESNQAKRNVVEQLELAAEIKADYAQTLESDVQERTAQLEVQSKTLAKQNEKLLEMDRLKSQFLANISHEFRTPLTLIKGPLQRLISGDFGPLNEQVNSAVETSSRNANRLARLMEELLTLSHLESNQLNLQVQAVEVNGYCRRIASLFSHQASERDIHFSGEFLQRDTVVFFDPHKLETVLCNLLSNAFKYTPRDGDVLFKLETDATENTDDGRVRFSVIDSGHGIPKAMHSQIFERFYRLEQDDRSGVEGSGIGLSLVRELTEIHGGSVSVRSRVAGGSEFIVELPLGFTHFEKREFSPRSDELTSSSSPTPEKSVSAPKMTAVHQPVEGKPILLLVEDVVDMRDYIASHFENDYHVITAGDGQQALSILKKTFVDIVITDLMMPLMDGLELLDNIRKTESLKSLPVLMLSARSTNEDRNLALLNHADDYIAKPFDSEELRLRVRNLLLRGNTIDETAVESKPDLQSADEQWLTKAKTLVHEHLKDPTFDAKRLAAELNMSKPTLHRHMERIAGTTPAAFMRHLRLEHAHHLIENQVHRTFTEVAYAVGFASPGYFSRLYKQRYP
jgi:signal transduction histidine kinase/DNA-binding response OmpR family regulator